MLKSKEVLEILLTYAEKDENIRGVLLEGSRAFGNVDEHSDFDIVYITKSSESYFEGAILPFLIKNFGEIALMQTPDNGDPYDVYTHLIQFANGIRIDLTFNSIDFISRISLESATFVLLDKDGLFANISPPSDADFWLKKPTEEKYLYHLNQFWWCSPYVAKAVMRNQLLYAMELFNGRVRTEYIMMLAFLAGAKNNWENINLGKYFTDIKNFLPEDKGKYYDILIKSYVKADCEEIKMALNMLMENYNDLAIEVADKLGYSYNLTEAEGTMKFIKERYT